MDRRDILAERPVESGRGFMPGVSVNPSRVLFTAGLTGRGPDGNLVAGGMGPQARRTFERLQAVLSRADARFDNVIKQLAYVTDLEAYNASGRAERNKFFGARPASTGLVVRRLADPAMLIEVELVVDLGGSPGGKPLLEKYNAENHGGDFYQGVIVNGGRLLYLAGQVANNPDGSVAGIGDWRRQAEKVYENIGHVLRDVGERRERDHMGAQHRLLAPGRRAGAKRLLQRRLPGLDPGRDPGSGAAGVPGRDRSDRGHRVGACTSGGSTMPFSTIATPEAKPVANYKMATRMEGGRLLYISGQVAWDATGNIVGKGDVRAQARQVFENLRGVLRAAGGDLPSLMKITTYITKLEDFPAVAQARGEVFQGELPASTLIVVKSLFHPDFLIEVEGVAAV